MQLGDFLSDCPSAPVEPVTFRVVWKDDRGTQTTREVRAVLAFVDAYEMAEARRDAKRVCSDATKGADAPPLDYEEEAVYHVLSRALRDSDDPRRQFCPEVVKLRKALVPPVAGALMKAYNAFVTREFPDVVSDRERAELEAEAAKKS